MEYDMSVEIYVSGRARRREKRAVGLRIRVPTLDVSHRVGVEGDSMAERKNFKVFWQYVSEGVNVVDLFVQLLPCGTLQGPGMADENAENESRRVAASATTDVKRIV